MNNTQLISASRQIALARELDVIANNVANITTTGFKRRTPGFAEYLMPGAKADSLVTSDKRLSFVQSAGTPLDMAQGSVERTGNPLDVAIRGEGFLAVQTPQGERYTRAGSLALNAQGQLVTMDGHIALSDGGPLTFSVQDGAINIGGDGTISTGQGARGRLKIVSFERPHDLENISANLYKTDQTPIALGPKTSIVSGALERSNVSSVTEVARMIEVSRAYSNLSQMMQRTDDMRRNTISKLADIS